MLAKVTKLSSASVREAAEHRKRVAKAEESADVRAEVASSSEDGGAAVFRLLGKARAAVGRTAGPSSEGHVYSEWLASLKIGGIAAYDRVLTGGDKNHILKLHNSQDIDIAVRELAGGLGGVRSPLVGLALTAGSISTLHKLGGEKGPVNRSAGSLEPVVE